MMHCTSMLVSYCIFVFHTFSSLLLFIILLRSPTEDFGFCFLLLFFYLSNSIFPKRVDEFYEILRDGRYCSGIEIVESDFLYVTSSLKNGRFNWFFLESRLVRNHY